VTLGGKEEKANLTVYLSRGMARPKLSKVNMFPSLERRIWFLILSKKGVRRHHLRKREQALAKELAEYV